MKIPLAKATEWVYFRDTEPPAHRAVEWRAAVKELAPHLEWYPGLVGPRHREQRTAHSIEETRIDCGVAFFFFFFWGGRVAVVVAVVVEGQTPAQWNRNTALECEV